MCKKVNQQLGHEVAEVKFFMMMKMMMMMADILHFIVVSSKSYLQTGI